MDAKRKFPSDIRIIISEGIAGLVLALAAIVLKPNPDFTRGLFTGFGGVVVLLIAIIVIRRLSGKRRFGEMDERELRGKRLQSPCYRSSWDLRLL